MRESGFILITVLLFTLMLSLIITALVRISLMESKMSDYYQTKVLSLIDGENKLIKDEADLAAGKVPRDAELIPDKTCGVKFYRIKVVNQKSVASGLSSTYAKLVDASHCGQKPKIKEGRKSFIIVF